LAALGLALSELTGSTVWDGLSSVAIGVLLLPEAVILAWRNASLRIGQALPVRVEHRIEAELSAMPEVDRVVEFVTILIGPGTILVAAKVDFADASTVAGIEQASEGMERHLIATFPGIRHVYLDPTPPLSSDDR
jgi:divalent metal cation (Fe/Co/Zn/Cd) transporter